MAQPGNTSLPESLYSADAVQKMDRYLIENGTISGFDLMQRAASAAFRQLVRAWGDESPVTVFCGAGNNGGDGYLIAASAARHGCPVRCIAVSDPQKLKGDARLAYEKALADGVSIVDWGQVDEAGQHDLFSPAAVIVDAMLGTGSKGAPRTPYDEIIRRCNGSGARILAVDVPSGLDATCGAVAGQAIEAALTVTFIGLKAGLFTAQGPAFAGRVLYEPLVDSHQLAAAAPDPVAHRLDWTALAAQLPRRRLTAHKGQFGHVLVIAGDRGFGGAGLLAAEAAARSGAGLVSLATRPEYVAPALARCPSLMVQALTHGSGLPMLLDRADVVVCGPGIGQGAWGQQMLQQVMDCGKPLVLDADALNLLGSRVPVRNDNQVLTPHPGEAARLLGCEVSEVESDRLHAAASMQQIHGGVVLLKGAGTVIAGAGDVPGIVSGGNPGMATGGMGDVLSGIIGAFLAQGMTPSGAARTAAALHLAAADEASLTHGYRGLLPMEVIDALPALLGRAEGVIVPGREMAP